MNIGYACINMTVGKKITTNRTMVKKTFNQKGLDYVSELALLNAKDVIKILEWNRMNGIKFFRLSSTIIPWGDNFDITQLKDYKEIKSELKKAGDFAKFHNIRIYELLTFCTYPCISSRCQCRNSERLGIASPIYCRNL